VPVAISFSPKLTAHDIDGVPARQGFQIDLLTAPLLMPVHPDSLNNATAETDISAVDNPTEYLSVFSQTIAAARDYSRHFWSHQSECAIVLIIHGAGQRGSRAKSSG
jgi:hypothetical protein